MRYPRRAHNTGAQQKTSSAPKKPTGIKKKTLSTAKKPSSAAEKTLSAQMHTSVSQNDPIGTQDDTLPAAMAQEDTPVAAGKPQVDRNGLADSILTKLPPELRLSIMKLHMQRLRKIAIIPKALTQDANVTPTATSIEPSLVFTSGNPLLKTCYHLHTEYTNELRSRVLSCKIPTLVLHVRDFDFSPLTREIFPSFEDSHREYFNARAGAITVRLTITKSFFTRAEGEEGFIEWLQDREDEPARLWKWFEWREAEEKAGRKVSLSYKVERNADIEGREDMEALRLYMLLFDPYSDSDPDEEVGVLVQAMIKFFKAVGKSRSQAQMGMPRAIV